MASLSSAPSASIIVPTRMRPDYLEVALASIAPQAANAGAELIVVDDAGPSESGRELAERFNARYEPHPRPLGLNVARNTGVERSTGELVVFVDDDVEVRDGWLTALLGAARDHPDVEVFTGPIIPRLEGSPPHSCGRAHPPITSLDLGPEDIRARYAWGANMAIRRRALERIGPFDISLEHGGDEQEWQERLIASYGEEDSAHKDSATPDRAPAGLAPPDRAPILYIARAALEHRRSASDARLAPLCRGARARGRAARRFDIYRDEAGGRLPGGRASDPASSEQPGDEAPALLRELRTLAGCLGHVIRHRCPAGLTMVAHSFGRVEEALHVRRSDPASSQKQTGVSPDDFLSGESGTVGGLDGVRRTALDLGMDALELASGRRLRLRLAARSSPSTRRVLVLCLQRPEHRTLVEGIRAELACSRHDVQLCLAAPANSGKFENLNLLLTEHPLDDRDWLFVIDDDIMLPYGFIDRFLFLAERFRLDLAQPAHRRASHAAWRVTRRQPGSVVRETRFVEIGPVTAFARSTFQTLLPFPDLRMGWGLDVHWAALARQHGWHCGVIDAVAIRHRAAPAASAYSREQALAEARSFLEHRPYLSAGEAQRTLVTHRRW